MSLSDRPKDVFDRHLHVVEHQRRRRRSVETEFDFVAAAGDAHAALDEEGGEFVAVNFRENREEIGEAAVGDPHLRAVQQVVTAVGCERRGGPRSERVGSGLRLGERVRANQLAAGEPRQIARFLLVVPEVHQRQRADRRMRAERAAERRIHRDLLADVRRADQVEAEAAVLGRNLQAQEIEIARLFQKLTGELPVVLI